MNKTNNDLLSLEYKSLSWLINYLYEGNPKNHDLQIITESIIEHGFRDPVAIDRTLDKLVVGHGRIFSLAHMFKNELTAPRGIKVSSDGGDWLIPTLFGVDASSIEGALKYLIDHNNAGMMGGDYTDTQISYQWNLSGYLNILEKTGETVTASEDHIAYLLTIRDSNEPLDLSEGGDDGGDNSQKPSGTNSNEENPNASAIKIFMTKDEVKEYNNLLRILKEKLYNTEAEIVLEALSLLT